MRKFAITGALCAIALSAGLASAKDDFSALLSELSYAQPAHIQAAMPSYKVAQNTSPMAAAKVNAVSHNQLQHVQPAATQHAMSMPANAYSVGPAPAAFSQGCDVGCASGGCADGGCASGSCEGGFCTPHNQPNLPGSTLRQYWRSNSCNSNVWDGYQNRCHKPVGSGKKRSCLDGGCGPEPCDIQPPSHVVCDTQEACDVPSYVATPAASCDAGTCDSNGWTF